MNIKLSRSAITHTSLALLLIGSIANCSETTLPPHAEQNVAYAYEEGVAGGVIVNTIVIKVKVLAVNTEERTLTLMDANAQERSVKVGPEVINFDQIRPNDMIDLIVAEETIISVSSGENAVEEGVAGLVALAPKGAKPGAVVARSVVLTAKVIAIDETNRTATLEFKDGSKKVFPVRQDLDLSKHKTGEEVVFQITQMIAIGIEKTNKATK